jgi:hypothetical protein
MTVAVPTSHSITTQGTSIEEREGSWLDIGSVFDAAYRLQRTELHRLDPSNDVVVSAVAAGADPDAGSDLADRMLESVLAGQCAELATTAASYAGDLLRVLAPQHFLRLAAAAEPTHRAAVGHTDRPTTKSQRSGACKRLKDSDPLFEEVQRAARFRKGQRATTSPWVNTARALTTMFGPCWLAAEIAVVGASSPSDRYVTGGGMDSGTTAFGDAPDYRRLVGEVRAKRSDKAWWRQQFDDDTDPLSRATWALALLSVADASVVTACLEPLGASVEELPISIRRVLLEASSRLGASDIARRLSPTGSRRSGRIVNDRRASGRPPRRYARPPR